MDTALKKTLEKLVGRPGQGSILEQIDKIVRKQQRTELYEMLEQVDKKEMGKYPVVLVKSIPQTGKKIRHCFASLCRHGKDMTRSSGGPLEIISSSRSIA